MGSDICIISQYWEPDTNGDVTRLRMAVEVLQSLRRSVTLIAGAPHYPSGNARGFRKILSIEERPGVRVIRLRMPSLPHKGLKRRLLLYLWFCIGAMPLAISYGKSKYIWAFSQRAFSTFAATPSRILWRSKLISDVTDIWPEALANTRYTHSQSMFFSVARMFASTAYRLSDTITTLIPPQKEVLVRNYGLSRRKIFLVPNTSQDRSFKKAKVASFVVLYYGNLGKNYDFTPIIEAARRLESQDIRFVITGTGEQLEGVTRASSGLRNLSIFSTYVPPDDFDNMIASAGALILPMAHQEFIDVSFPIKFVEYIWSGRPLIYINGGYPKHLIQSYDAGIAIAENDIDALISAILLLSKDCVRREEVATHALGLARSEFSRETFANAIAARFQ